MEQEKRYYEVPYNSAPKTGRGKLLFWGILLCYWGCWAVYFGFMNELIWIGPITLPMAWTFLMNAFNTVFVYLLFKWFYAHIVFDPQKAHKKERNQGSAE
jgi:hypothetical protein